MPYKVRFTVETDLLNCARICLRKQISGEEIDKHVRLWYRALKEGSAVSVVVVDLHGDVAACWLSCSVASKAAEFALRIRSGLHHLPFIFPNTLLNASQCEKAHRTTGVDLLLFFGTAENIHPDARAFVSHRLFQSFLSIHRGLNINSILCEVSNEKEKRDLQDLGFREHPTSSPCQPSTRVLMYASRAEIVEKERVCLPLFELFCPSFVPACLNRLARLQLQLAYFLGTTDTEIAQYLKTTTTAVRQRWHRIGEALTRQGFCAQSRRIGVMKILESYPQLLQPVQINRLIDSDSKYTNHRLEQIV